MRARRRASRARARVAIDPGVGVGAVSPRATKDMNDGSTTVFGRLGASRGDTHVGLELGLLLLLDDGGGVLGVGDGAERGRAAARGRAGGGAQRAGGRLGTPWGRWSPLRGRGAPTRAAAAGVVRETRAPATGTRQKTVFAVTAAIVRSVSECGGALERCEMRARGAQPLLHAERCEGEISELRFCRRPPGTLSANQNAPRLTFGSFVSVSHAILRVTFGSVRSIRRGRGAPGVSSPDRRSRRGLHHIPPRARRASSDAPSGVSVDHAVGVRMCDAERELYWPERDGKLVEGAFSIVARDQAVEQAACVVKCAGASTHDL